MITENLSNLVINNLTKTQYQTAILAGTINQNELYLTDDPDEQSLPLVTSADEAKVLMVKNGEWAISEAAFPKYTLGASEAGGRVNVVINESVSALVHTSDAQGNVVLSIGG